MPSASVRGSCWFLYNNVSAGSSHSTGSIHQPLLAQAVLLMTRKSREATWTFMLTSQCTRLYQIFTGPVTDPLWDYITYNDVIMKEQHFWYVSNHSQTFSRQTYYTHLWVWQGCEIALRLVDCPLTFALAPCLWHIKSASQCFSEWQCVKVLQTGDMKSATCV